MKKAISVLLISFVLLTGCNLAGDVTPPPGLIPVETSNPQRAAPANTSTAPSPPEPMMSPVVPAIPFDLAEGSLIYEEKCAPCHGDSGLGDGSMSGSLEIAPTALGDPEIGREAVPAEWYEIVTNGRMNRFMPPFSSLTDTERWHVVGYALSLSVPEGDLERGGELYTEMCAPCHGDAGEADQNGIRLADLTHLANHSLAMHLEIITNGRGAMPAFGDEISTDDLWALSGFVRSFGYLNQQTPEVQATEPEEAITGTISGIAIDGSGDDIDVSGLEVVLLGFDSDQPVITETTSTDTDGYFEFRSLEVVPGRIFGAFIEFDGARHYSTAAHFLEEAPFFELPIVLYKSTIDRDDLDIERLHLVFDYSVEGLVEVSELWLISNVGTETVLANESSGWLEIPLPDGYQKFQFVESSGPVNLNSTGDGVILEEPILPGETIDLIFSFYLPYGRNLDFHQDMDIPPGAIVALTAEGAPEILGEGVEDLGARDMGDMSFRTYSVEPPNEGEPLQFEIMGRHPNSPEVLSSQNLIVALGVLGGALILVGLGWWYFGSRRPEGLDVSDGQDPPQDKEALLHAIAALDDAFDSGDLDEDEYQKRRSELKKKLTDLMRQDRD